MTKVYTLIVALYTTLRQRLEQSRLEPEAGLTTVEWSILIALGAGAAAIFGAAAYAAVNSQTAQLPGN